MSLVLNDEQEKALREWYESRRDLEPGEQFSVKIGATKNLLAAIAPLMKPWRVEENGIHWQLCGPDETLLTYLGSDRSRAERICRVLNGEERW